MSIIRHINCSLNGNDLFVTAEFEKTVSVWSYVCRRHLATFDTNMDFGGKRLAIVPSEQPLLITGAYERHGICGYNAVTGKLKWQRKDLKKVQYISCIPLQNDFFIGAGFDEQSFVILNPVNGETIQSLRGVRKVYPSQSNLVLQVTNNDIGLLQLSEWKVLWKKPKQTFALLDAVLSHEAILLTWSSGSTQCIDFEGNLLWEYKPKSGFHFLKVTWNKYLNIWSGVLWNYQSGGTKILVIFDRMGNVLAETNIGEVVVIDFFSDGNNLVTSDGKVFSIPSMEVNWDFLSKE